MTTTERVTLPEIPGVNYDVDGRPMWSADQLDDTSREILDRIRDPLGDSLADVVFLLGEDIESAADFDEIMALIHQIRGRAVARRAILERAGWTEELGEAYYRQDRINRISAHPEVYAMLVESEGLPADPQELDLWMVGQVSFAVEAFVDPELRKLFGDRPALIR